jgi:solute:Na+ symporter, SSS family
MLNSLTLSMPLLLAQAETTRAATTAISAAPDHGSLLRWVVDGGIILVYMVAMVAIGMYAARHKGDTKHYFAGRGNIPPWAVGMSILATLISSVTFLAYPGSAFAGNWILLVQGLMVPIVLIATVWFIVPIYRHTIGISAYEYFERRFNYGSRLYTSLAFSVMHFTKTGSVIFLLALALSALTGIHIVSIIIVVSVVTLIYTLIGGMEAVIWTDVVQGFLFLAGGVAVLLVLLFKPEGGPVNVIATAWKGGKIDVGPYDFDLAKRGFWVLVINGVFYALQKYATDQTMVQRYLVNKSDRGAIKATLMGGLLCVPTWTLFMFIGSCLWAFYQITKTPLVNAAGKALKGTDVFPHFISTQLPLGVTGLVLAALLAAAMSTISSDLNCLSAVIVEDYYRRLFPKASDRSRLLIGKFAVAVCGSVAAVVALVYYAIGSPDILETIFELYAIFAGGLVGLFALGFLTRRATWQGALIGIGATVLFCAWGFLTSKTKAFGIVLDLNKLFGSKSLNFPHDSYMLQVYPHFILFGVGYLASFFFARPHIDADHFTLYGHLARRRAAKLKPAPAADTPAS